MTKKNALARAEARLAKKEEGVLEEKARIKNLKKRETKRERDRETRRKILIGAYFKEKLPPEEIAAAMDTYLDKPRDRALFGLEPLNLGDEIQTGMEQAIAHMEGEAGARVTLGEVDESLVDTIPIK